MAHLSLSLLGSFEVTLDGRSITGFKSNKERALLAYLAVEAGRSHRREVLAGLLWPDWPDRDALNNLRYTLSDLRRVIGDHAAEPPFLLITRDTLQFNLASDHSLDVATFAQHLADSQSTSQRISEPAISHSPFAISHQQSAIRHLQSAISLYRGHFLEGFSVGDSAGFEEWALVTRERLARQMLSALHELAATCEQRGEYEQAQSWAWRQIELEPSDETAHQQLMRALALGGQRSAALAQYEACRSALAEELGVEPAAETTRLYEQIRDGKLQAPAPASAAPPDLTPFKRHSERSEESPFSLPTFLQEAAPQVELSVFVARDRELAKLDGFLQQALAGQGRVAFVTGEAGSGKTALVQEFTRRAQASHAHLGVANGNCNAYTGIGDPYLPFREILELLAGDVEARWAAGAMTREDAGRLWRIFPVALQALVEAGPDLIDTFVPRAALLERAMTYDPDRSDWQTRLGESVEHKPPTGPGVGSLRQNDLFEQYTKVLQAIARRQPLLLVLDDLQWADLGSISLLFHLGRRLAGSRILIVGAYRSEEVALGREGARHPLEPVVNEFQRDLGEIMVNLDQAENRGFFDAFLDSEPNCLGAAFRETLYRQTGGHPLFTIELLRGLQERRDLVRDPDGRWVEGPALNWETLPARVEAVIAERISRLAEPLQAALRVASVEGEIFTGEVAARVRAADERELLGRLSGDLDRRHRLIRAQSIVRIAPLACTCAGTGVSGGVDGQVLSRYRFRHFLCQKYLYNSLDEVERVHLHEQVGTALEGLCGAQGEMATIAVQLARHFQEAGITHKAVHYLHQAGKRAVRLSAYEEAIAHLTRGLALLMTLPDSLQRAQQELDLQICLGMARMGKIPSPEWEHVITRARELCQQTGKTVELCRVLAELSIFHYVRAEHRKARELAQEALDLAQQTGDPLLVVLGHWHVGFICFSLGEFLAARDHLGQMISFYQPQEHHQPFVLLRGSDAGVSALAYDACCLWCLGYPDQALRRSQEALALAHKLDHAFSLADALCFGGCVFNEMRRDAPALKAYGEELARLSQGMGFSSFLGTGSCYSGEALTKLGQTQEGIVQIREGIAVRQSVGAQCHLSGISGALAEAQAKMGQLQAGLATLSETLALVPKTGERYYEAELHRLWAELLLMQGEEAEAEACLHKAIEVAHRQQAKSWELRAAITLGRLWQSQGRGTEAHRMLAETYDWFTEGFDTPDLQEARVLLQGLAHN